jgi:undecaprenyl-diphosphatase
MTPGSRFERYIAFLRARVSPEGLFGLHLTVGSIALVGSAWLFGGVAEDLVTGDPLTIVDALISDWFRDHATTSFAAVMALVSSFASTTAVLYSCILASAYLLWKRWWYALLAMALVVPGGALLNLMLKMAFARARPSWGDVDLLGYSFPSGHTMTATLVYGLLGVLVAMAVKSWWWRATAVAVAFMLICAVGFSRIYLGAHYLSDVVAAFAAGVAWLAICLTAVETLRRHKPLSSRPPPL